MLLEVSELNVAYSKTQVLWDLSIAIEEGEIVMIAGSNGAGKSTLLKTIVGLIPPRTGVVRFKDRKINGVPTHTLVREGISLIPEGGRVFPGMTVSDNLDLGMYQERRTEKKLETRQWVYQLFPILRERKNQYAKTLSGGQRQMLAVAIGLMSRPDLLLIDEPSSGLAPMLVKNLLNMIREIRDRGVTILLVEQNVRAALGIADRGYVLENGRMMLEGTNQELRSNEHVKTAYLGI
jgi:branched-chain amino acid transport system ATP-binding protein